MRTAVETIAGYLLYEKLHSHASLIKGFFTNWPSPFEVLSSGVQKKGLKNYISIYSFFKVDSVGINFTFIYLSSAYTKDLRVFISLPIYLRNLPLNSTSTCMTIAPFFNTRHSSLLHHMSRSTSTAGHRLSFAWPPPCLVGTVKFVSQRNSHFLLQ